MGFIGSAAVPSRLGILLALVIMAAIAWTAPAGAADNPLSPAPYSGRFANDKMTVELTHSGDGYAGTISMGANQYPARATEGGQGLSGTFAASGAQFDFMATLAGDQLILRTGTTTYTLTRVGAAAAGGGEMPAAGGGMGAMGAGAAGTGAAALGAPASPAGFVVLGSEPDGKTLFIKLSGAAKLDSAIVQTADDLGKYFGGKPALSGAFGNPPANTRGGALFTAKLGGADVHGWIFCSATNAGATATVIYAAASATQTDIQNLFAFMPAELKMQTHQFPDGSGSVDLPPGWTTQAQSLTFGVGIQGPAGQGVVMGSLMSLNTPTGLLAKTRQQNYQMAMGMYQQQMQAYQQNVQVRQRYPNIIALQEPKRPDPPDFDKDFPGLTFCRVCSGPEEVLKYLYPEMVRLGQKAGQPYTEVDKVFEIVPAAPNPLIANDKAGVVYMAVTDHNGDSVAHYRVINRMETFPILDGSSTWMVIFNVMRAPDATFDADLPVMNAILTSFKMNMDVVNGQIQKSGAAIRKMGDDNERALLKRGQDFQVAQAQSFDRFESQIAAQEQARHDSNSDFIEYIKGVRDVYDTGTGQMSQVDLSDVHGIVNGMNAAALDPNRFVEIPLRYER